MIERVPPPVGDASAPLQALIFDSHYDQFRGVVSSIRVMNGTLRSGARIKFMQNGSVHDADEIGSPPARAHPGQDPDRRRDRLPDRQRQGRGPGPLR